jgi:hypothetical protein
MNLCNTRAQCTGFDINASGRCTLYLAAERVRDLQGHTAGIKQATATPAPSAPQPASASPTAGYQVDKLSNISGPILTTSHISIDASKPDPAIASCARLCDATTGCAAFDISVVYAKCTLYGKVEKKGSLGGYISGVKIPR